MMRAGYTLGAALLIGAIGASHAARADDTSGLVERGAYLARAADCVACHTAPGGQAFAGGLRIATPLGTIISTNITPSRSGGIGDYSETEFAHAVRDGVRKDGANLYPVMPYTAYSAITDDDIKALYAYFHTAVAPVDQPAPRTALAFPFNIRTSLAFWNILFRSSHRYTTDPAHDAEWNRGAYLANALEHCGTCHTPRNLLMAEKSVQSFGGASLGVWYAPNITPARSGIGSWSVDDLATYLGTGSSPTDAQAGGEMREAIDHSLSHLTPSDLHAIATFVHSMTPVENAVPKAAVSAPELPKDPLFSGHETHIDAMNGRELFQAFCATCHQAFGQGTRNGGLPSLVGNTALRGPNADNVAASILQGIWPEPHDVQAMPAFAKSLTDAQITELTNTVMQDYGKSGVRISVQRVQELRNGGAASPLILLARIGMGVATFMILVAALFIFLRRRR